MKNLSIMVTLLCFSAVAYAQQADRLRLGADLGIGVPAEGKTSIIINLEPKYNLANTLSIGLRGQSAFIGRRFVYNQGGVPIEGDTEQNLSLLATLDQYFPLGFCAPYIGAGVGIHNTGEFSYTQNSTRFAMKGQYKLAGMLRAGIEISKFRLTAEYNIIPNSTYNLARQIASAGSSDAGVVQNSYFGATLGFFLGGGRWDKQASTED